MSARVKLTVLGGSALATPKLFEAMARGSARAGYDVWLHGRDVERLELVARVSRDALRAFPDVDITVFSTVDGQAALEGADFVLNQIRAGGLEGRRFDETFPRQFGIPGEETVGPGGFSNALRGIPVVLDVCHQIERVAPAAVLLNLTNPSSIIQSAIRRFSRVNVVGTCDSPVTLMEMLAQLLGARPATVVFDMVGMHHFSWVSAVRAGPAGADRLVEVLARLEELPKLGVEPELLRGLGAVPSPYLRYYFHPDRVLAATEGRPVRAQELMELGERMLADFRQWQPGRSPRTLAQRGAVWYDKIVAPALLALAERQTTELVLSVDNQGTLTWLPPEAIIEAPVPIRDGRLGTPRSAALPLEVRALLHRNCAYEMLAAEAIAEHDRAKAERALLANLLVSNYNQARGILDLLWPRAEAPAAFSISTAFGKPQSTLGFKVPQLFYGQSLVEDWPVREENFAVITMPEPWTAARPRLPRLPAAVVFVQELDWYQLEALERQLPPVEAVVAVGGGVATDTGKYLAWRRRVPVDVYPSIVSVDASVTKSVAARAGGHVTYIGYIVPRNVYVDYPLIQGAPPRLNRSGLGDILSAHTALWDWELAHASTGEKYDPEAAAAMRTWLERAGLMAAHVRDVTPEGVRFVMEAFEDISIICRRFGSSRPQEASEHTFAYCAEFQTGRSFLHGELVALGAVVLATLQDNRPDNLRELCRRAGLLWQPSDLRLTEPEFRQIMQSLNWYQKYYGRRYSVLDERKIDAGFIDRLTGTLEFA